MNCFYLYHILLTTLINYNIQISSPICLIPYEIVLSVLHLNHQNVWGKNLDVNLENGVVFFTHIASQFLIFIQQRYFNILIVWMSLITQKNMHGISAHKPSFVNKYCLFNFFIIHKGSNLWSNKTTFLHSCMR